MTEKRFKYVSDYDWWGVIDTTGEIKGEYDNDCFSTYTVVDLLNKLNDECEFLEIENESLEDGATKYAELCHKLSKENEQLKSREHDLALELNALVDENEQLKQELNAFKPVVFQDMRKGTVILYRKGDVE